MDGEASDRERREALEHTATCASCHDLRQLHESLAQMQVPEPDEVDLLAVRRAVMRTVRNQGGAARSWGWGDSAPFSPLIRTAVASVAVMGLLAVGIGLGRWSSPGPAFGSEADAMSITGQVELAAARAQEIGILPGNRFVYSNVQIDEVDAKSVRLAFDVSTRLDLVRTKDDPLVAEVLVQSLVNRAPIGARLDAIEAVQRLEPRVRDALIASMLADQSLAVRLKAISKLTAEPGVESRDEALREALLEVLRREKSVQMRLVAIDYLTRHDVAPDALRSALDEGRPEPGTAVYASAQEYLRTF